MKNDYISEIFEKDKLVLHPYEDFNSRGTYNRKLITNLIIFIYMMRTAISTLMVQEECGVIILVMAIKKLVKQ